MMWMMMLACALPLLVVSFTGAGRRPSIWLVGGLGAMLILHWLAMRFMHRSPEGTAPDDHHDLTADQKPSDEDHHQSQS